MIEDVIKKSKEIPEQLMNAIDKIKSLLKEIKEDGVYQFMCMLDPDNAIKLSVTTWESFVSSVDDLNLDKIIEALNDAEKTLDSMKNPKIESPKPYNPNGGDA